MNVNLQCNHDGKIIACNENSELLPGTIVHPTCIPKYKYYSSPPNYTEIKCNDDGKWDKPLSPCIPGKQLIVT